MGHLPRSGVNDTHKPYIDELQIVSSLCMQNLDLDTAVKFATPEQLHDRVGSDSPRYHVQGVHAAGLQLDPLVYAGIRHSGYLN